MDISYIYERFLESSGICTDTRKITPGCFFVALKGGNYDANRFAQQALDAGAGFAMVDDATVVTDARMILVPDSLEGLQRLASYHRQQLALPIIALTGSNGKTTTKELINAVLSSHFKTGATVGNLNNHIGVPLTLLSFTTETQIGIVEMGANHQREIAELCQIAAPDFGYITNFGKAHLEGFGGVEGVIKGKSELYDHLRANDKLVFVNGDDPIQMEKTQGMHRSIFGTAPEAEVVLDQVQADPFVRMHWDTTAIVSNLIGLYNAPNISAAVAIGNFFNIPPAQIALAIAAYLPQNNRSQIIEKHGNRIILDAYNANPSSMAAALTNFLQLEDSRKKVIILGDMFELGDQSPEEHQAIVERLKSQDTQVHFIGPSFAAFSVESQWLQFYPDLDAFRNSGVAARLANNLILIKGSRGMALERVLDYMA